jgi:energy-coupling factor transporter transmembrane protein EcfT
MYKIGGILYCVLEGILVAHYGWMAIVWSTIGFIIGLFLTPNIVLPILMGMPIAFFYLLKKQIRPRVILALSITPLIWIIILFSLGWFFPSTVDWLSKNETFKIGFMSGCILIILSPISKESRKDFKMDFDKSYGRYYIE